MPQAYVAYGLERKRLKVAYGLERKRQKVAYGLENLLYICGNKSKN